MNKGDTYNISGQAGAVGPGAHSHDNDFQQIQSGIDLPKLAEELGRLRAAMKGETTGTREQDKAMWPTRRRQRPMVMVQPLCDTSRPPGRGRSGSLRKLASRSRLRS